MSTQRIILRSFFALLIIISIGMNFYVHIVLKDHEVFTNPEGPDTSDYFLE